MARLGMALVWAALGLALVLARFWSCPGSVRSLALPGRARTDRLTSVQCTRDTGAGPGCARLATWWGWYVPGW